MKARYIAISALAMLAMQIVGCATHNTTEVAFGSAVRQVTHAQIYDPEAAANPDPEAVVGGDPERLNNTLDGHRKDIANPQNVGGSVTINVGGSE